MKSRSKILDRTVGVIHSIARKNYGLSVKCKIAGESHPLRTYTISEICGTSLVFRQVKI